MFLWRKSNRGVIEDLIKIEIKDVKIEKSDTEVKN